MTKTQSAELVTRESILELLSDEENARVSMAETAARLMEGQEYLDLERLEQGVQRAKALSKIEMGHILPRSSVRDETWKNIVSHLAS